MFGRVLARAHTHTKVSHDMTESEHRRQSRSMSMTRRCRSKARIAVSGILTAGLRSLRDPSRKNRGSAVRPCFVIAIARETRLTPTT